MELVITVPRFTPWRVERYKDVVYLERETRIADQYRILECIDLSDGRWCVIFQSHGRDMFGFQSATLGNDFIEWYYSTKPPRAKLVCRYTEGISFIEEEMEKFLLKDERRLERVYDDLVMRSSGYSTKIRFKWEQRPSLFDGLSELIRRDFLDTILWGYANPVNYLIHLIRKIRIELNSKNSKREAIGEERTIMEMIKSTLYKHFEKSNEKVRDEAIDLLLSLWSEFETGEKKDRWLEGFVDDVLTWIAENSAGAEQEKGGELEID